MVDIQQKNAPNPLISDGMRGRWLNKYQMGQLTIECTLPRPPSLTRKMPFK